MSIVMGPVLGFRGAGQGVWRVSVLAVVDDATPPLVVPGCQVGQPTQLLASDSLRVIVWDVAVPTGPNATSVQYTLGPDTYRFWVPAEGATPKMAYASCNGFSDPTLVKRMEDKFERWRHLAERHDAGPFHLLLLGGDQVYGDEIWTQRVPALHAWSEKSRRAKQQAAFDHMRKRVQSFYFDLYTRRWAQEEVAIVLASIPTLMMWDDHDIFDGWGSHEEWLQDTAVFKGVFEVARTAFSVFQRQAVPGVVAPGTLANQPAFSWGHVVGKAALLGLDLRSERTNTQVMSAESWAAMAQWLEAVPAEVRHLVVLSSVPVVYADFGMLEGALGWIPGDQELEDDLRDHWQSPGHRADRLKLIHRLLAFSRDRNVRVTIVSGDVHVGALGVIESSRAPIGPPRSNVINQLVSSAIVHPAPPATVLWAIRNVLSSCDEPDQGIVTKLIPFPNSPQRASLIPARNWLALEPDAPGPSDAGRLWACWHIEGEKAPLTKAIHPVG